MCKIIDPNGEKNDYLGKFCRQFIAKIDGKRYEKEKG